jgi:hypothetical protein
MGIFGKPVFGLHVSIVIDKVSWIFLPRRLCSRSTVHPQGKLLPEPESPVMARTSSVPREKSRRVFCSQLISENLSSDIITNGKPCPYLVNIDGIIAIKFGCPHSINNLVLSPIEIVQIPAEETIEIVSSLCIGRRADLDSIT